MSTFAGIFLLLVALWILSFFVFHLAWLFINILLIVAVVVILVRIIQGKNPFGDNTTTNNHHKDDDAQK